MKHIEPRKLSQQRVYKYTFSGKRVCTITVPETHVSHVIIVHAGTNNLRTDSAKQCVQNIKNLVSCVKDKFPSAKIGISGLIMRYDIEVASIKCKKSIKISNRFVLIMTPIL